MEQLIGQLAREIGGQWVAVALGLAWLVYKSGLVHRWIGVQTSERERLSKDQQLLIENLYAAVDRLDRRLTEERVECDRQIELAREEREARLGELRAEHNTEIAKLREEIASLIRGESRWRHLTGNLAQYIAALQGALRKAGLDVPRFGGWDQFIADGGEPLLSLPIGDPG